MVGRFNQSLKYEHLHRLEINQAWELAEEVEAFLRLHNEVRPHEAIGFKRPLEIYLLEPHLFWGESVQETWRGTLLMRHDGPTPIRNLA